MDLAFTASLAVGLRETLEAVLLLLLVYAGSRSLGAKPILVSAGLGFLLAGGILLLVPRFANIIEKGIFEAATYGLASLVILWASVTGHRMARSAKAKIAGTASTAAITAVLTVIIAREAVEASLMAAPLLLSDPAHSIMGLAVGVAAAMAVGLAAYKFTLKIPTRQAFAVLTIALAAVGAWMAAKSIEELAEYIVLPLEEVLQASTAIAYVAILLALTYKPRI